MLLKLRHTHPLAVTFLLIFLPADLYLFTCLAFCSGSHFIAVAAFKNAILQCAVCTFTHTFFSSICSDEMRDGPCVLQDRTVLVREWFPVWTLLGQWLVWFSTGTRLAAWCGKQRHIALMQPPVPSGTEGQQQGPVGTSALSLWALYPCPAIAAHVLDL